jgi:hypothetical protein
MIAVLLLFLLPVGGGIPAGVLLAQSQGLGWAPTAGLYLVSDLILALAFEPVLRGLVLLARRSPSLARFGTALQAAMARSAAQVGGPGLGPIALVMVAFGVDPMTGRSAALAAGHGFLAGWAIAIVGDLLYYAVVALATLRLHAWLKHPEATVWIVLAAMLLLPILARRLRPGRSAVRPAEI